MFEVSEEEFGSFAYTQMVFFCGDRDREEVESFLGLVSLLGFEK